MSTIARSVFQTHTVRALAQWPKDSLRPGSQLQDVLSRRLETQIGQVNNEPDPKQLNALSSLLENRYRSKVSSFRWAAVPKAMLTRNVST